MSPPLFEYLTRYPTIRCAVSPPLLLKHLRNLCGVPTQVWTSDQIPQIEMCGCQSSSTCISECGTPSWACFVIKDIRKTKWGSGSLEHINYNRFQASPKKNWWPYYRNGVKNRIFCKILLSILQILPLIQDLNSLKLISNNFKNWNFGQNFCWYPGAWLIFFHTPLLEGGG